MNRDTEPAANAEPAGESFLRRWWPKVFIVAVVVAAVFVFWPRGEKRLRLATTTSTENSGLLAVLLPPFERATGAKVDVVAVGTGAALKLGENGDADVLLVHAPAAEEKFMDGGFGVDRQKVMHNDFVIIGPADDPENLRQATSAVDVFRRLAAGKTPFISRGDDSGTDKKEKSLWAAAGIAPKGEWYREIGQGMGAVLTMAGERNAYTLTDRGTYLAFQGKVKLPILYQGADALYNPYHVIAVNAKLHPQINSRLAQAFVEYITGEPGQRIIAGYQKHGQQLFYPDVVDVK